MDKQSVNAEAVDRQEERPAYVTPLIQAMSEKDILTKFQITQSMGTWWTNGVVTPCT